MCFGGKEISAAIGGIFCESGSCSLIEFRVGLTALLRTYFSSAHVKTGPGWLYCGFSTGMKMNIVLVNWG